MSARGSLVVGVDVGTGSARAGVFTLDGRLVGRADAPIEIWQERPDHVEQSSEDIWRSVAGAVGGACREAAAAPDAIVGLGFDATCSLVAVDESGAPVTVSLDGDDNRNVIVWMDHRAVAEADAINATNHSVLQFVGGSISPEMETPKLRWVQQHLPETWRRTARWFDLADYLTWRATGVETRSLCTTVCKWTYLGHEHRFDPTFFRAIGLDRLADDDFAAIGARTGRPGDLTGMLTTDAAAALGLTPGTAVAVPLIDAHAGALGMLGAPRAGVTTALEHRLAIIAGTSACHIAVSRPRIDVPGVWGPYWEALLPDHWLTEAGISASGALLDHVLQSHPAARLLPPDPFPTLHEILDAIAADPADASRLTHGMHVQPNVLGNRSPLADAELTGGLAGRRLDAGLDDLAVWYLAALQSLAYATRHICEALTNAGRTIELVVACGGSATNEWWLRAHADALDIPIALPAEPDAVLLGSAMLGATAAGEHASLEAAMAAMTGLARVVQPDARVAGYHDAKYRVYRRMIDDGVVYREMMRDA